MNIGTLSEADIIGGGLSAGGAGSFPTVGSSGAPWESLAVANCVNVGPLLPGEVLCGTDMYGDTVGNPYPAQIEPGQNVPTCMSGDQSVFQDGYWICVPGTGGGLRSIPTWGWAVAAGLIVVALMGARR